MVLFIMFAAPMVLVLGTVLWRHYMDLRYPTPLALGSALPKLCAVSANEIRNYCENEEQQETLDSHLRREISSKQARVMHEFIEQMAWNTKLIQQVARFEEMKIDPAKSSLEYQTPETLTMLMVEESSAVRWLLVKAQMGLTVRAWLGRSVSAETRQRLLRLMAEYKQLEQDAVALVGMASDDFYYKMLVERLGLTGWKLTHGGPMPEPE